MANTGEPPPTDVFRVGGVTYLRIPAPEPRVSGAFYRAAFGWRIHDRGDGDVAFEDATGHVIGHFLPDLPVAGAAGILPYVSVADVDETLAAATANGGRIREEPYPEGDLWVATVVDPAGNVVGLWQQGPRTTPG